MSIMSATDKLFGTVVLDEQRAALVKKTYALLSVSVVTAVAGGYFGSTSPAMVQLFSGRLGWLEARPLLVELVSGLAAAHSRRVVHGSLSPSCCWVNRPDFGKPSLRVLGFGLNANPSSDDANATRSRTNVLSVDAVFMAPETAGAVFGDERSDVYMAGLVAWFMLVGRPPSPERGLPGDLAAAWHAARYASYRGDGRVRVCRVVPACGRRAQARREIVASTKKVG